MTRPHPTLPDDERWMRLALQLARRGYGRTSPNPMVGAVLVRSGQLLGQGWHHRAGQPHAEIEALADARRHRRRPNRATLYVTLEPCSTHGRTPPCTEAILTAGVNRVVVAATDPNPAHRGRGLRQLRRAGLTVVTGLLRAECLQLNEAFHHWIAHQTPWVTVKSAMTLDGKIADAAGASKWITGPAARRHAHRLRAGTDAILVGINTLLADDPSLTARPAPPGKRLRRVILDSDARTPLSARVVTDADAATTTIVVTRKAPHHRVEALRRRVQVWVAPAHQGRPNLLRLLEWLGQDQVTSLLVEGGGEVNAAFLEQHLAHRVAFFYAPKILGGHGARPAVAGRGAADWPAILQLLQPEWHRFGPDLFLTARVKNPSR